MMRRRPPSEDENRQPSDNARRRRPPVPGIPMPLPPRLIGWCFLELDREYFEQRLLPELATRHFSGATLSSFHLAVLTGDPQQIIYATDAQLTVDQAQTKDGEILLFSPRANFGPAFENASPQSLADDKAIPPDTGAVAVQESAAMPNSPADAWLLVARHRGGSIGAVVNGSRRRDLAVGFGVLSLLMLSVSLIILSTHRMRVLARRQMEFVAGVSHELRTPMSVIQSAGFNLGSGRVQGDDRVRQYGTMIQTEGRRLAEMVEQILSYAGIQSGRNRYQFAETKIAVLIEKVLKEYEPAFEEGGWQVEKQIDANLPLVSADATALESAIKNLLQNALKYAAAGKWLRVSASATSGRKPEVQITVEDHGSGIDPVDLPHIFSAFYRGREVLASATPGAGLGLSLLQRHLKAHGGRVTVETKKGAGAAFTLHLPVMKSLESSESLESLEGSENLKNVRA